MNIAWAELAVDKMEDANVIIKGIPFDNAASVGKGAALAPDNIRKLSKVLPNITETGIVLDNFGVKDEGDFEVDLNWERYFLEIEEGAKDLFQRDKFCIFLGGDHSVTIPLEKAFVEMNQGKKVGVIHFDSHCDILNEYIGSGWAHACTQRRALEYGLKDEGLTFVGVRSWEAEELDFLVKHSDITIISAEEVYELEINAVIDTLVEKYINFDAVYMTIDIDVLDPAYAPGTGTPEGGGLSTREMMKVVKLLVKNLPIKAMDIVEVSPPLDVKNNITSWAALKLIYEVFGALHVKG